MLHRRLLLTGLLFATGCSSSSDGADPTERVGDIRTNDTWANGTKLTGVVRIYGGATVEIAPGAQITCSDSVQIVVAGKVRVASPGAHAKISCPAWTGFLVAQGGSLDITGLDIENAATGYETTPGAGAVTVSESSILASTRPFTVRASSTLTLNHVTATTPTTTGAFDVSISQVWGTLDAHYLSYQANGNEGVMTMRDGTTTIEDSTITGVNGFDLVSAYGAKSVTVRYSTMTGAHCGGHIDASKDADRVPTQAFTFDHVTSENNQFGITIYATGTAGPLVVKDSNFRGLNSWIDIQGDHGTIAFTDVYTEGRALVQNTDPPTFGSVTTPIADAKPR